VNKSAKEPDYIVVGAGSAGCVVAARLSDAGYRVALLEAGGSDKRFWIRVPVGYGKTFFDEQVNWKYLTQSDSGLNGRSSYWPRGKVIGGSSSINAMVYYRGLPHDYDDWALAGNPSWSWNNVQDTFHSIENFLDSQNKIHGNGVLKITDPSRWYHCIRDFYFNAARELKLPHNPNMIDGEGVGDYCITSRDGLRCSAANAFLYPALKNGRIELIQNATAQHILFDDNRATGIEYKKNGHTTRLYAKHEVIICGGAINSPKLLEHSGIGDAQRLSSLGIDVVCDSPHVGENLQDHIAISYFYRSKIPTLNNQLHSSWGKVLAGIRYLLTRKGPLALSVNQCGGFVRSDPSQPVPNMQLYVSPITYSKSPDNKLTTVNPDSYAGFQLCFQPSRPKSRGSIHVDSTDPQDHPIIMPKYLSSEDDVDDIVRGGVLMKQFAQSNALGSIIEEPIDADPSHMSPDELVEDFRNRADTVFHPCGTCRMGMGVESSVVNERMKVHGANGLRVIDASVFPNVTSGNTNGPTIMLAYRSAGFIIEDQQHSNL